MRTPNFKRKKSPVAYVILLCAMCVAAVLFGYENETEKWDTKNLRFHAIDVGQGDSSLFMFPDGSVMLIDAGTEDSGQKVVAHLKSCGVKRINLLVATHPHSDHIGGMKAVFSAFTVDRVWDSGFIHGSKLQKEFYLEVKSRSDIKFVVPKRGYSETIGGGSVSVIAPVRKITGTNSDANNNCLVLTVKYKNASFLMMGDMEKEERQTVSPLPRCTVLKAAHHGSSNGTDAKVLRETRPQFIIFSYGKDNSYGHPHKSVTNLLRGKNIRRFDTISGTLKFESNGQNISFPADMEVKEDGGK